jgi:hypothetical protein
LRKSGEIKGKRVKLRRKGEKPERNVTFWESGVYGREYPYNYYK